MTWTRRNSRDTRIGRRGRDELGAAVLRRLLHQVGNEIRVGNAAGESPLDKQGIVLGGPGVRDADVCPLALGADVHQESELLPEFGQALGKGDAMWRALAVATGELIVYLDSDTRGFSPHFATGMLGPLICEEPHVRFVKAHFRRPYAGVDGEARVRAGEERPEHLLVERDQRPVVIDVRSPGGVPRGLPGIVRRHPLRHSRQVVVRVDVHQAVGVAGVER